MSDLPEKKPTCETCPYYQAQHPVALRHINDKDKWVASVYGVGCCMYDSPVVEGYHDLLMVWRHVEPTDFCHNHPAVKVMESSYMLGPMAKMMTNAMQDSFDAMRGDHE